MNPLENEIRNVLKREEPPAGFAERLMDEASRGVKPLQPMRSPLSRLAIPAAVILLAIVAAGVTGILMTRCASACTTGLLESWTGNSAPGVAPAGGGHSLGPDNAEFVLEEYGDYQCPSCGDYFPVIEEVIQRFPNQIRFEYHHFPLTQIHANAMGAAIAAEAAAEQNHLWEMHRMLYRHQKEWARTAPSPDGMFSDYAAQIGLDMDRFQQSLRSAETKQKVLDDMKRGADAKIEGTPTFFLNGQLLPLPSSPQKFPELLEQRLSRK